MKYGSFKKTAKIVENILFAATVLALAFAVALSLSANASSAKSDLTLLGYKPLHIVSGSMEPFIRTDSLILSKKADFSAIKVGDVISYDNGSELITHRVAAINPDGSITAKGDANAQADQFKITAANVKFTLVATMNWTAPLIQTLHSPLGIVLIALLLANVIQFSVIMLLLKRQKAQSAKRNFTPMAIVTDEKQGPAHGKIRRKKAAVFAAVLLSVLMCLVLLAAVWTEMLIITPPDQFYLFGVRPVTVQSDALAPDVPENSVLLMKKTDAGQLSTGQYVSYQITTLDSSTSDVGQIIGVSGSELSVSAAAGAVSVPASSVNGYALYSIGLFSFFAGVARNIPLLFQALIVAVVAILLLMLGLLLIHKALPRNTKIPADNPPVSYAAGDFEMNARPQPPAALEKIADVAPERAPASPGDLFAELGLDKNTVDEMKVDLYMHQLDLLAPDKIEDFFTNN